MRWNVYFTTLKKYNIQNILPGLAGFMCFAKSRVVLFYAINGHQAGKVDPLKFVSEDK